MRRRPVKMPGMPRDLHTPSPTLFRLDDGRLAQTPRA